VVVCIAVPISRFLISDAESGNATAGRDIRTVHELPGHADVSSTMLYRDSPAVAILRGLPCFFIEFQ
jgi:hypothetical protein